MTRSIATLTCLLSLLVSPAVFGQITQRYDDNVDDQVLRDGWTPFDRSDQVALLPIIEQMDLTSVTSVDHGGGSIQITLTSRSDRDSAYPMFAGLNFQGIGLPTAAGDDLLDASTSHFLGVLVQGQTLMGSQWGEWDENLQQFVVTENPENFSLDLETVNEIVLSVDLSSLPDEYNWAATQAMTFQSQEGTVFTIADEVGLPEVIFGDLELVKLPPVCDLAFETTPESGPDTKFGMNDEFTYTTTVTNNGSEAVDDLRLSLFTRGLRVVDAPDCVLETFQDLQCAIGTLAPGATYTTNIVFRVTGSRERGEVHATAYVSNSLFKGSKLVGTRQVGSEIDPSLIDLLVIGLNGLGSESNLDLYLGETLVAEGVEAGPAELVEEAMAEELETDVTVTESGSDPLSNSVATAPVNLTPEQAGPLPESYTFVFVDTTEIVEIPGVPAFGTVYDNPRLTFVNAAEGPPLNVDLLPEGSSVVRGLEYRAFSGPIENDPIQSPTIRIYNDEGSIDESFLLNEVPNEDVVSVILPPEAGKRLQGIRLLAVTSGGSVIETAIVTDSKTESPGESALALAPNYPNPFTDRTRIGFTLPAAMHGSLTVYDMMGRRVRKLVDGLIGAGRNAATWDGTDGNGQPVSNGVYFYRLTTPQGASADRMLLMR